MVDRFSVAGRTAFVTGASRGIGRAMAIALAIAMAMFIAFGRPPEIHFQWWTPPLGGLP